MESDFWKRVETWFSNVILFRLFATLLSVTFKSKHGDLRYVKDPFLSTQRYIESKLEKFIPAWKKGVSSDVTWHNDGQIYGYAFFDDIGDEKKGIVVQQGTPVTVISERRRGTNTDPCSIDKYSNHCLFYVKVLSIRGVLWIEEAFLSQK